MKIRCLSCWHIYDVNAEAVETVEKPQAKKQKKVAKKSPYQKKKAREYAKQWYIKNKEKIKIAKKRKYHSMRPVIALKTGELWGDNFLDID